MSVEQHTLSNGATVLLDPIPSAERAALGHFYRVGSRFEKKKENGLAHFLEHMAFKGTHTRDVFSLLEEMDDLGANSNAFTSQEATCYYMSGDANDIFSFNELVSDISINMALPANELEIERGTILEEILQYADSPGDVMQNICAETAFPDQAYGRTILGPSVNIENFDRNTFDKFRAKHYHTGNLIITAAGKFDPDVLLKEIEKSVANMPTGQRSTYKKAKYVGGSVHVVRPDNQMNLKMEFEASALSDPDSMAQSIMGQILGGGMSSRLFTEVREKRGLVYGVGSGKSSKPDIGEFIIAAGTSPSKVGKLMPVVCDEINKIRENLVSDRELARAKKTFTVSNLASGAESSRMQGNAMAFNLLNKLPDNDDFRARIDAVTKEDVLKAAQTIFAGKPTLASVGPSDFPDYDDVVQRLDI